MDASDRHLLRIGAVSGLLAAVGLIVVNLLHTTREDTSVPEDLLRAIAGTADWTGVHLLSYVPILLLVPWVYALTRQLTREGAPTASAFARLGWGCFVIGETLYLVRLTIHGTVLKEAASAWTSASADAASALLMAKTVLLLNDAFTGIAEVVWWGSIALVGLAVAVASTYPRVLGWLLSACGTIVVLGVGVPYLIVGPGPVVSAVFVFVALPGILLLFPYCAIMWRRSRTDAPLAPTA